jgi:hypothetical protein
VLVRVEMLYVFSRKRDIHQLCLREYHGHRRGKNKLGGCPNFGKKKGCPPGMPLLHEAFCLYYPSYLAINRFDLGSHMLRMRMQHPGWTSRQLRNCLYWQGAARKQLRYKIGKALACLWKGYIAETVPEAMGMDVTSTCRYHGIELEWPPMKWAHQVAFIGIPLSERMPQ